MLDNHRKTTTFRRARATRKSLGIINKRKTLSLLYFNTRGLSQSSLSDIKVALDRKKVDIAVIVETHHRLEQTFTECSIDDYKVFETRRSDVSEDKSGGGILVYCKTSEGLMIKQFSPIIEEENLLFVNNERIWILCDSVGFKTAICGVYMGCQFVDNRNEAWNSKIYSVIMKEQSDLRRKGYRIVFLGDMNGHIGNLPGTGVYGNKPDVNSNGRQLLQFVKDAEMRMVNNMCLTKGKCGQHVCRPLCSGTWTRQISNSSSIIDYVLISNEHSLGIESMTIDDSSLGFGGDSDHNMILVTIKDYLVVKSIISGLLLSKSIWNIKDNQDFTIYSEKVDKYSSIIDKSSVQSFASSVASVIHRSMVESIGTKLKCNTNKTPNLPPDILKELSIRRVLSKQWKVLQSQHERDKLSVPNAQVSCTLKDAVIGLEVQRVKVVNMLILHNKTLRKVNIKSCIGNSKKAIQNFWSFVINKERKSPQIKSIFNEKNGVLKSDPEDVLEETVQYVTHLFQGKFSSFRDIPSSNAHQDHSYCTDNVECPPPTNQGSKPCYSDHNYSSTPSPKLVSSDESKSVELDPVGFLNSDFSTSEVKDAIRLLKTNKAKGWDNIPNECLINTSPSFVFILSELFNKIKNCNEIPFGWNHGRLVLIHKRGPVEMIVNYRPLTVNICIMSLYSRLLNQRLSSVVEEHNLLGEIQGGFRKGRSGGDNNFVLNTIIWKAKAEGKEVHKAYIDIHKAYDSVNRKILWAKLRNLNFGEKFINCIENLYKDDCIQTESHGLKSRPIFLSRGVRQGCSLSPLLFALYLSDLGFDLMNATQGFMLMDTRISALFFADDLLLIARTSKGLNELLLLVYNHCKILKLEISVKSKIISSNSNSGTVSDQFGDEILSLERVSMYKYLGIETFSSMYRTGVDKQKKCILTARRYKGACANISFKGPDVSFLAPVLWSSVAMKAILFGCECIPFSKSNIELLNRLQSQMCKTILGLPSPVPNFVAQTELAIDHFGHQLWLMQLNSCLRWMDLPPSRWAFLAMQEHLSLNWVSPYWKYICEIKQELSLPYLYSKQFIKIHLDSYFIKKLNSEILKANLPSLKPVNVLCRAIYVCEDKLVPIFAGVKFNYCHGIQCQGVDRQRRCHSCIGNPLPPLSSEFHVVWLCSSVSNVRKKTGITLFINLCSSRGITVRNSFFLYIQGFDINGEKINVEQCLERAKHLQTIRDCWIQKL